MKKRRTSCRIQFRFWLDDMRQDERELITFIDELKAKHKFARAIRDGLRLIKDLQSGGVAVLLELFPDVKAKLQPDNSELVNLITAMMHNQPVVSIMPKVPAAPVVVEKDESKARATTISNTLAALDDF